MVMILQLIQGIENDDDRTVVERIYYHYYKFMVAKANSILNNSYDAEDAVMEAFCNISENVKMFPDLTADETASLVCIITKNIAINMYNRKKKQQEIFDMSADVENQLHEDCMKDTPQALVVTDETIDIVRGAIEQLDEKYKFVIILKYYYHMKNAEIAKVLNLDRNMVNTHIFRAKKKLKEILGEEGHERITY